MGCQKTSENGTELNVRFIEHPCCGNLMIMENETIEDFEQVRFDSLTYGVNMDSFIIIQNLALGDELRIEYEVLAIPLSEDYEIDCTNICNRHSGIPIKILNLEKI